LKATADRRPMRRCRVPVLAEMVEELVIQISSIRILYWRLVHWREA